MQSFQSKARFAFGHKQRLFTLTNFSYTLKNLDTLKTLLKSGAIRHFKLRNKRSLDVYLAQDSFFFFCGRGLHGGRFVTLRTLRFFDKQSSGCVLLV